MTQTPRYATLRDYLRVIRAHRLVIALAALAFAAAALVYSLYQKPVYVAQASISFEPSNAESELLGSRSDQAAATGNKPVAALQQVRNPVITRRTKNALRGNSASELRSAHVTGRVEQSTGLLVVEARSGRGQLAADLANATSRQVVNEITRTDRRRYARVARELLRQARRLPQNFARASVEERLARFETLKRFARPAQVSRAADTPSAPASPKPVRNALLGLLLGLTLGVLAAFVRDVLDRRLRNSQEIEEHLDLSLLGHVNEEALGRTLSAKNGGKPLTESDLEAFRILRTNIELFRVDEPLRTLAVTSALPGEGKTTVASALAVMNALAGKKTLLLECDLRRPTLDVRLGIRRSPGLSDFLAGNAEPQEILQHVDTKDLQLPFASSNGGSGGQGHPGLVCIAAGSRVPLPGELFGSKRFREMVEGLKIIYEVVVIDTSPLLAVADTREIIPLIDGVLLCVRASRTTKNEAGAAKQALERLPSRPTALVVTGVPSGGEADYGYYSYANEYGESPP